MNNFGVGFADELYDDRAPQDWHPTLSPTRVQRTRGNLEKILAFRSE